VAGAAVGAVVASASVGAAVGSKALVGSVVATAAVGVLFQVMVGRLQLIKKILIRTRIVIFFI
jgi:hypothetical protein